MGRIFLTGDMHAALDDRRRKFISKLDPSDILIVLGDFGYTWTPLRLQGYKAPCMTLLVDGNHDNFSYLDACLDEDMFGSTVKKVKDNVYRLMTGNIYEINGLKFFVFGGALSIDKEQRIPYVSWWPEEVPSKRVVDKALDTLHARGGEVDFMLSHTCPEQTAVDMFRYPYKIEDPVEKMLSVMEYEIESRKGRKVGNFFGHHHKNMSDGVHTCLYGDVVEIMEDGSWKYAVKGKEFTL